MKKLMLTLLSAAVALGVTTGTAKGEDKQDRERLNKRIHEVDDTVKKQKSTETALRNISVETGVPLTQVESMHRRYPDVGPAGVLMAAVLADETKKQPEQFLKDHAKGKDWGSLAYDNHVAFDKLSARLERLEGTLSNATTAQHVGKTRKK